MFVMGDDGGQRQGAPRRRAACMAAAAGVMMAGLVAVSAPNAFAVGGNCTAVKENVDLTGPDGSRVRASCSSLQGDSKAQGSLDLVWAPDLYTAWFTSLNVTYRSGYDRGPSRGASYAIAHV